MLPAMMIFVNAWRNIDRITRKKIAGYVKKIGYMEFFSRHVARMAYWSSPIGINFRG